MFIILYFNNAVDTCREVEARPIGLKDLDCSLALTHCHSKRGSGVTPEVGLRHVLCSLPGETSSCYSWARQPDSTLNINYSFLILLLLDAWEHYF